MHLNDIWINPCLNGNLNSNAAINFNLSIHGGSQECRISNPYNDFDRPDCQYLSTYNFRVTFHLNVVDTIISSQDIMDLDFFLCIALQICNVGVVSDCLIVLNLQKQFPKCGPFLFKNRRATQFFLDSLKTFFTFQ